MERPTSSFFDRSVPFLVFGSTVFVFFPVLHWLLRQTVAHEQLTHAFLVFVMTLSLLVYERRISFRPVWRMDDYAQNLLLSSYALLAVAVFLRFNLIILASLCLSLAALLVFIFGTRQRRLIFSAVGAFAVFTGFAVMFPVMDWPLRSVAGQFAAYGLGLVGQEVQLGIHQARLEPMLILLNNGQPFHVAAECNGFGMLSSSLLMATIVLLYRNISWTRRLGGLGLALGFGLILNAVRIVAIVLLAARIPDGQYMLMHEAVGLLTTYGGLAALYVFLMPRRR